MIDFANCKINIGLNITSRRDDGFHELVSVFYPVKLNDILEISDNTTYTSGKKYTFTNTGFVIDEGEKNNLCIKAYNLLDSLFDLPAVNIHLHKKIPLGAGLGGGSSDAALMLKMLNTKFKLNLSEEDLINHAATLGSDCAFFIKNNAQHASGRGEILQDINLSLSGYYILLIKPEVSISTKEAYSLITPKPALYDLKKIDVSKIENWRNFVTNDFEMPLFTKYPLLDEIKKFLYSKGALYASMSGSGSALFGIFKNEQDTNIPFHNCFVYSSPL